MGYRLGVDLGTTFTAAAVRRGDAVTIVGLGNRAMQIPSVLYLQPDGTFLVGEVAEARAGAEPDRVAREFKRRIGDPVPIIVGGTPFSAELLTARLLSWVVAVASEREGSTPDAVTVSYPANWGTYKTDLLRHAFALSDLPQVATCTEPAAAAITYATRQRVPEGAYVAVYDLGGGTFDAAVLRHVAGGGFELLGRPEGIEHLGGVDFDEAVFQHALRSLRADPAGRLAGADLADPSVVRGLERLRRDCVLAKETLSTDTEVRLPVTAGPIDSVVRLTRAEFEDMIRPALDETVAATHRVLRSAHLVPADLTAILLIGGSSRIPLVSEVLSVAFGRPLALDAHPKHDVATGAAWLTGPLPQPVIERSKPASAAAPRPAAPPPPSSRSSSRSPPAPTPDDRDSAKTTSVAARVSRRPTLPLLAVAACLMAALLLAFVAPGASVPADPAANGITLNEYQIARHPRIPVRLDRAIQYRDAGNRPVQLSISLMGIDIAHQRADAGGTLQFHNESFLLAGPVHASLLVGSGTKTHSTRLILVPQHAWIASVPGVALVLGLLYVVAYLEAMWRRLRRPRRSSSGANSGEIVRFAHFAAMAGLGIVAGAVLVDASWLITKHLPVSFVAVSTIIVTAIGFALLPLAIGRPTRASTDNR